jgi:hypothetical protein
MQRLRDRRLFFFIGLLAIAILYSIYNLYLLDTRFFTITTRMTRHVIKLGSVLLAYGIGLLAYKRFCPAWLMQLWHILYATGLLLLVLLGVYDGWISQLSMPVRNLVITWHEFLISPVPYVIVGIINSAR